jgi:hypothetical protein
MSTEVAFSWLLFYTHWDNLNIKNLDTVALQCDNVLSILNLSVGNPEHCHAHAIVQC